MTRGTQLAAHPQFRRLLPSRRRLNLAPQWVGFGGIRPVSVVAKAFNTVLASLQANPNMYGTTLDALFATDDDHARKVTRDLIASMGFRAVDAGPLAGARELEALAWLNIKLNASFNGSWISSAVFLGLPAGATTELVKTSN